MSIRPLVEGVELRIITHFDVKIFDVIFYIVKHHHFTGICILAGAAAAAAAAVAAKSGKITFKDESRRLLQFPDLCFCSFTMKQLSGFSIYQISKRRTIKITYAWSSVYKTTDGLSAAPVGILVHENEEK
ncbi:hypothetical protein GQX74_008601 [Glossina fuscipes]|nr:hypothetical protein GQX74_008601 [Glossina fuscipes]